jgi:hypothetical protein
MPDKQVKRLIVEMKQNDQNKLNLSDKGLSSILDLPEICKFITRYKTAQLIFKQTKYFD